MMKQTPSHNLRKCLPLRYSTYTRSMCYTIYRLSYKVVCRLGGSFASHAILDIQHTSSAHTSSVHVSRRTSRVPCGAQRATPTGCSLFFLNYYNHHMDAMLRLWNALSFLYCTPLYPRHWDLLWKCQIPKERRACCAQALLYMYLYLIVARQVSQWK